MVSPIVKLTTKRTDRFGRGTLPPKLLLETLLTSHDVLFPTANVRDKKSRTTLEAMSCKHEFDAERR
jgi:hypothetical protein